MALVGQSPDQPMTGFDRVALYGGVTTLACISAAWQRPGRSAPTPVLSLAGPSRTLPKFLCQGDSASVVGQGFIFIPISNQSMNAQNVAKGALHCAKILQVLGCVRRPADASRALEALKGNGPLAGRHPLLPRP